ncbi:MAG: methyltransferase domain-containing protein [Chloroflexota bacterium]|nr:methyltransferase domain-containing protein [Chloroflexota bacterium]
MNFQPSSAVEGPERLGPTSFEPSLAPRDGDMLSLPFDQYGRMRVAQTILNTLYTEIRRGSTGVEGPSQTEPITVLDVGGYPGILRHFLQPEYYSIAVVDVVPDDGTVPGYVQGSGMGLPFPDGSVDVVTALDTLEHIPSQERQLFLSELARVARYAVVLINPVQSVPADLAEETLNEYIRWIIDAQQEQLAEHRGFMLPDAPGTEQTLQAHGFSTVYFPLANVYNWLLMMIAKHYLLSMRDEKADAFERTLDRFYNLTFSDSDRAEPAYRRAIVAVRPGLEGALSRTLEEYPRVESTDVANAMRLQLTQVLMSLLDLKTANHEDYKLREQLEHRDKHIYGLETRASMQETELNRLQQHTQSLESGITDIRKHYEGEITRLVDVHDDAVKQVRAYFEAQQVGILAVYEAQQVAIREQLMAAQADLPKKDQHITNLEASIEQMQEAVRSQAANHQQYVARMDQELISKNEHILYLEKLLRGIERGRVFRLTRTLSRVLRMR